MRTARLSPTIQAQSHHYETLSPRWPRAGNHHYEIPNPRLLGTDGNQPRKIFALRLTTSTVPPAERTDKEEPNGARFGHHHRRSSETHPFGSTKERSLPSLTHAWSLAEAPFHQLASGLPERELFHLAVPPRFAPVTTLVAVAVASPSQ